MINIISPSSLNTYIKDPALWVLRTFYKLYGDSNIYAVRGKCIETYVNGVLSGKKEDDFKNYALSCMKDIMFDYVDVSIEDLKDFFERGKRVLPHIPRDGEIIQQTKVKGDVYGLKMAGYMDYEYEKSCLDLKTVEKLPKICSKGPRKEMLQADKRDNVRQQVIYRILSGKPQSLLYVDPQGEALLYNVGYKDYREHLPIIKKSIKEIKRLLTLKIEDVIIEIQPDEKLMNNPYSFGWNDLLRNKATEIWEL